MHMHEHSWNNHCVQIYHCDSRNRAYIRLDISVFSIPVYQGILTLTMKCYLMLKILKTSRHNLGNWQIFFGITYTHSHLAQTILILGHFSHHLKLSFHFHHLFTAHAVSILMLFNKTSTFIQLPLQHEYLTLEYTQRCLYMSIPIEEKLSQQLQSNRYRRDRIGISDCSSSRCNYTKLFYILKFCDYVWWFEPPIMYLILYINVCGVILP